VEIDNGAIGSLKFITTGALRDTIKALLRGTVDITVGGIISGAFTVVKLKV
jgi:hypothetical protein